MINKLISIFKVPELRKRILFTLFLMFVARVGIHITLPGVNLPVGGATGEGGPLGGLLNYFDMFAGGGLRNFSIFSLGIIPYISASIIMQLLTVAVPYFERLQKEGEFGRRKINKYTKYLTIVICAVQAYALVAIMSKQGMLYESAKSNVFLFRINSVILITAGTAFLMWVGDLITEKGIGNGISMLIMMGIVARFPYAVYKMWKYRAINDMNIVQLAVIAVALFGLIALIVLILQGERRIPIQNARRAVGGRSALAQNYMPFKVNQAGVIPVIFASSVMMAPYQIFQFVGSKYEIVEWLRENLVPTGNLYLVLFVLLIVFFTFFYVAIQFNPADIADNLKKNGSYIPGIRPGENTAKFLEKVLNRISLPGAIFLSFIAILPNIIRKFYASVPFAFGGTGLLIVVGVDLEIVKQIESYLLTHHYEGFLKSGKIKGRR